MMGNAFFLESLFPFIHQLNFFIFHFMLYQNLLRYITNTTQYDLKTGLILDQHPSTTSGQWEQTPGLLNTEWPPRGGCPSCPAWTVPSGLKWPAAYCFHIKSTDQKLTFCLHFLFNPLNIVSSLQHKKRWTILTVFLYNKSRGRLGLSYR